jgi:hypothetical protein
MSATPRRLHAHEKDNAQGDGYPCLHRYPEQGVVQQAVEVRGDRTALCRHGTLDGCHARAREDSTQRTQENQRAQRNRNPHHTTPGCRSHVKAGNQDEQERDASHPTPTPSTLEPFSNLLGGRESLELLQAYPLQRQRHKDAQSTHDM